MNNVKSTDTFVALDIGTSKVLCLVADIDDKGELRIVGIGNEQCTGLNKGIISEIDATVSSVRRAKEKAAAMSTCNIQSVTTGIAGNHIQSYNGNGAVNILNDEVTKEDKEKVLINAQNIQIPKDQEILQMLNEFNETGSLGEDSLQFLRSDLMSSRDIQAVTADNTRKIVEILSAMAASSSSISGTTSGGGGGGSLKITVATQAPRLIGLVRNGVEVMVSTAAVVMMPPSRRVFRVRRLKSCTLVLKRLTLPLFPKGLAGFAYQDWSSSER